MSASGMRRALQEGADVKVLRHGGYSAEFEQEVQELQQRVAAKVQKDEDARAEALQRAQERGTIVLELRPLFGANTHVATSYSRPGTMHEVSIARMMCACESSVTWCAHLAACDEYERTKER